MNNDKENSNLQEPKQKKYQQNKKINGFAVMLFALVITSGFPITSQNWLSFVGLALGFVGLIMVLFSKY